jgi:hypothetical protein
MWTVTINYRQYDFETIYEAKKFAKYWNVFFE